jgi:hypothetical protein
VSKKVRVRKINLDIRGKELSLSLKEAQELKDVLNDMFGVEEVTIYRDRYSPYWQPWYYSNTGASCSGTYTISDQSNNDTQVDMANATLTTNSWDGELTSNSVNLSIAA